MNNTAKNKTIPDFPLNVWYVAALGKELTDKPLARTLLNHPVVLYRTQDGIVHALEDRCCHRHLPLSMGTIEEKGIRCGYHGLLFDEAGNVIDVPGQDRIPPNACVKKYEVVEQDAIVWIWFGSEGNKQPTSKPPSYEVHSNDEFVYGGDVYRYNAPYQLIHDNLLDLSHLGYVHLHTIGGDAKTHMNAKFTIKSEGNNVTLKRYLPNSTPPPTYTAAYPFKGKVDRWQEIEFCLSHLRIWTGAVDLDTYSLDDPERKGFHMRGFHGITPETNDTSFYFWTIATNPEKNVEEIKQKVVEQTRLTFDEDKVVVEAQYANMQRFGDQPMVHIHVDAGPTRVRRIIEKLKKDSV